MSSEEENPPPGTKAMALLRWLLVVAMAAAAIASLGHFHGWFAGASERSALKYSCCTASTSGP